MNRIAEILIERDGMTKEEAEALMNETREEIFLSDPLKADEIMMNNLGLEMDYIFYLI